jgi:protein ImuB
LAYERLLTAAQVAWPRFTPREVLEERLDFEHAARIENLEPVLFLLRALLHRIFLRLSARRESLVDFDLHFHLSRFSPLRERLFRFRLPLPHSDPAALLALLRDRLERELQEAPLAEALEGLSLRVLRTAPVRDRQRDFFSRAESQRESFSSLVALLRERLGEEAAFLAAPAPRLLPEASWRRCVDFRYGGEAVLTPLRPLRLLRDPLPLWRNQERLTGTGRRWRIRSFRGPERLGGEWWLKEFEREYFRVETETETLWVFRSAEGLFLHGIFD